MSTKRTITKPKVTNPIPDTTMVPVSVAITATTPGDITSEAQIAARALTDLVSRNGWSLNIQGNKYLKFEAWQTLAKFYHYTVRTKEGSTKFVEFGAAKGFEAYAEVVDERTGQIMGGAESMCLNDEKNWSGKPLFSLRSMAQTRAGGKALRQMLGWVAVLAGYKPTPAEEMDHLNQPNYAQEAQTAITQVRDRKRAEESTERETDPDWINQAEALGEELPLQEANTCVTCGEVVTNPRVIDYSRKAFNRVFCFKDQPRPQ